MLLSAVSVLVVAQSSSEIPEGLMNNSDKWKRTPHSTQSPVWFTLLFTARYFLLDGELLTETFHACLPFNTFLL